MPINNLTLLLFFVICLAIFYFGNCILAKKIIKIEPKMTLLYISTVMLFGILGETFANSLFNHITGSPLWQYHVYPINHAHSSQYAFFLWGIYGLHLYLLHEAKHGLRLSTEKGIMPIVFGLEGLGIELLVNSLFLLIFGKYLFYYPSYSLWHLTSFIIVPLYIIWGHLIWISLKHFKKSPYFFTIGNLLLTGTVVFLA